MKRFSRAAAIMFIAAVTVAITAITFIAQFNGEARRNSEIQSAFDRLIAAEAGLDRDLLKIIAGLLPYYDTLVDLSRSIEEIYGTIELDDSGLITSSREEYRRRIDDKMMAAELIKGLAAFVINEENYLQFEVGRYAATAAPEIAVPLQSMLIAQFSDRLRAEPVSTVDPALLRQGKHDELLANLLTHFTLLREQHRRLHEAMDGYFAIDSRQALERLRGHYIQVYRDRQERGLAITQALTILTVALFVGLGWTMIRLGRAHGIAEDARRRLLDAVNSLEEGFALFDGEDRMILTNPPYEVLVGEDGRRGFSSLVSSLGGADKMAASPLENPNQEHLSYNDKTGRWLLFRSRGTAEGGVVCLLMDMTESKRLEAELQKLTAAIEQSPLSVVITDERGCIEYVNPTFSILTGYSAAEVLGRNPRVLKSGQTPHETFVEMWNILAAGMTWRGELFNRKKNGDVMVEQATIFPVSGFNDRVRHYIAIKEDVTLSRKSAQMIVDAKADMERLLFAASHDLQEPIRDILLQIQLLERQLGPKATGAIAESLGFLRNSGLQLRLLIKGLLDYNRSNRPMSASGLVDCRLLVERAVAEIGGEHANASRITLEPLPSVQGDPVLLSILFENLISNALKFTRPGIMPEVKVSATAEGGGWRIDVADNGIGIEECYLKRIVQPFSRLHARAKYPGAGLGLATAAKIATLHDGRLWLSSEFGVGTTAHLWLPAPGEPSKEVVRTVE